MKRVFSLFYSFVEYNQKNGIEVIDFYIRAIDKNYQDFALKIDKAQYPFWLINSICENNLTTKKPL